jgi:acyl-CoA synthetase (AMP-forming)/AMP-acid ligase II
MNASRIPQVTLERFETAFRELHLIHRAADWWAARWPDDAAVINATRGTRLTWAQLQRGSRALAAGLKRLGFRKGDFLAASLPLADEHILLEFACFRLGVIHAPLDLRLQPAEVLRSVELIGARGYAFPGKIGAADFGALAEAVRQRCGSVEHLLQLSPAGECLAGAVSLPGLLADGESEPLPDDAGVTEYDGAQVIFTTGTTGSPKPALLSHRGITCQNLCLGTAFGFGPEQKVLCNLPASHVGGQAEILLTSLFMGGTAVTLEIFDPAKSLEAIERYGVTLLGQIPAMFELEWRTADYPRRNLSSLQKAVYGGQAVPRGFLDRMLEMAPAIATGLGLTEASGFCTYTAVTPDAEQVAGGIGWAMPAYPFSIRAAMREDGTAGRALAPGEAGHVCFAGPQNFLGYINDLPATAAALSTDGWLYTGDMGYAGEHGLHFSGRAKWVLKPAGYQVFPGDVENHFATLEGVATVGVVGHPHHIWHEAIVAFVEKRPGAEIAEADLRRHARSLTSYMRPLHYVILEPGSMPLNRTAKVDVPRLQEMACEEARRLRERGRWE